MKRLAIFVLLNLIYITTFSQDIIIKSNGEEIESKVKEITEQKIKYKNYDHLKGPLRNIKKSNVFMIIYENGKKEKFISEKTGSVPSSADSTTSSSTNSYSPLNDREEKDSQVKKEEEEEKEEPKSGSLLRGGISDVTGYAAYEYMTSNMGFSVGWHQYTTSFTSESKPSFDLGVSFYGTPYDENSWYASIGYATTNGVQRTRSWYEDEKVADNLEWSGAWAFIGGYRFGGDILDLKVGAGYITSEFSDGVAIDLSLGIVIAN